MNSRDTDMLLKIMKKRWTVNWSPFVEDAKIPRHISGLHTCYWETACVEILRKSLRIILVWNIHYHQGYRLLLPLTTSNSKDNSTQVLCPSFLVDSCFLCPTVC